MKEGDILKKEIFMQDLSIKDIAAQMGISRNYMYALFEKEEISPYYIDRFRKIGIDIKKPTFMDTSMKGGLIVNRHPIPYYDVDAIGGKVDLFREDHKEHVKDYIEAPFMKDCSMFINVSGDSMYPTYKRGDIIGIKRMSDFATIEYGQPYVIVTKDNRMIKYIRKSSTKGKWLLCSENKAKYDDFEIDMSKILHVFLVRGIVRIENL